MFDIVDIKKPEFYDFDLKKIILEGIDRPCGKKDINTLVLYDDRGLQLFDQVTYVPEYYLTEAEIDILRSKSDEIVEFIPDNSAIIELGSGSLRKTKLLLDAVNSKRENVHYYALDVMEKELTKSLQSLGEYKNITTHGFWGTYDDGMDHMASFPKDMPKIILWMGSSIGNLSRQEAHDFLVKLQSVLNPNDRVIVGIDLRKESSRIALAYDDPSKVSRDFIMNGLNHCNFILKHPVFDLNKFSFLSKVNDEEGHHESKYLCHESHVVEYTDPDTSKKVTIRFEKNEEIHVEFSFKYSHKEISDLIMSTRYIFGTQWIDSTNSYTLNLLCKPESYDACLFHNDVATQNPNWKISNHNCQCPVKPQVQAPCLT